MLNRTPFILKILFVIFCYIVSSSAYAKAILQIAPSSTTVRSVKLAATGSTTLIYSVKNNTNTKTVNNLIIDPYYGIPANSLTLTVQNNNCTGSLAPGASCSFGLLIQGNGQATNAALLPRVCEYSSGTCSVPTETNRISITAGGVGKSIAYILNPGNNTLSICSVNSSNGALGSCTRSTAPGLTLSTPTGLVVNPQNTTLFIANYGNGSGSSNIITICPIIQNGTGALGPCTTSTGNNAGGTTTFNNPDGVGLNPAGTILYVTNLINAGSSTVSICPVITNGATTSLGPCTTSTGNNSSGVSTFNEVQTITLNTDGTYAYICNGGNQGSATFASTISICPVIQNGSGALGTCTTSSGNGTFQFPEGLSFSPDNTYVYVGNFGNTAQPLSTVSICPLLQNGSGAFGTCTTTTGNGTFNFSANQIIDLFMSSPSYYGYIPNDGSNTISVCPINTGTHNLNTCTTFSDSTFNQPSAISLSYNIS